MIAGKAKVACNKDQKLADMNKMPGINSATSNNKVTANVNGASSSKRRMPILCYVPKSKKDKGHPLKLQGNP